MNKTTCSAIQRKLDELPLDYDPGSEVSTHLVACPECRDFQLKGTKLRQLVGSLETVAAPSDFDFRLRARLANENSGSAFHFWSLRSQTVAAALGFALLVGVSFAVFQATRTKGPGVDVVKKESPAQTIVQATASKETKQKVIEQQPAASESVVATIPKGRNVGQKQVVQVNNRNRRASAVAEFSSEAAPTIRDYKSTSSSEAVFPVDASQQKLRLSLFDSRGNPKTISLPSVSFGSQRVVPTNTSYAPKGVW